MDLEGLSPAQRIRAIALDAALDLATMASTDGVPKEDAVFALAERFVRYIDLGHVPEPRAPAALGLVPK